MKTEVKPYEISEVKPLSFIYEIPGALTPDICRSMISRFELKQEDQYEGRIGQQISKDREVKKTTDLVVSGKPDWKDIDTILFRSLGLALKIFQQRFPYFKGPFRDMGYNLQRYRAGEFYHWHIDGGSHDFSHRQLVAIWYLNDVPGPGGTTDFLFQDVSITPEEGKLVLFPPFWTHEHRSATLEQGTKYIATTWVIFA